MYILVIVLAKHNMPNLKKNFMQILSTYLKIYEKIQKKKKTIELIELIN